jgi:hypothetical protein
MGETNMLTNVATMSCSALPLYLSHPPPQQIQMLPTGSQTSLRANIEQVCLAFTQNYIK